MNPVLGSATDYEEPRCPTCGSEAIVRCGYNSCGTQQYLCKSCGAHRVLNPKSRSATETCIARVVQAVRVNRLSLRAAERMFGVARQSISRWLRR